MSGGSDRTSDVSVEVDGHVATIEVHRPPNNFFDVAMIADIADALDALAATDCRAVVLGSEGRHFCAGADFGGGRREERGGPHLYEMAVRLFEQPIPVIAAVQGAAIGGGFGLAMAADFRVATPEARFAANFARLGFHHGFGLSVTLPLVAGHQVALDLLYTGRRVNGEEAQALGLVDRLVEPEQLRAAVLDLAAEIATSAPLAVRSIRETMRGDLATKVRDALARERGEQDRLTATSDWREGVAAMAERRPPNFTAQVSGPPGFWQYAAEHPDRPAAIDVDGRSRTFGELGAAVDRTSHWLRSRRIGPDAAIAIVARNSVDYLAVVMAANQIGTRYTLVNSHLTPPEIAYIVEDCGAALIVTDAAMAETARLVAGGRDLVSIDRAAAVPALADVLDDQPAGPPDDRTAGVAMLYTSGTSGRPKGVRSTAPQVSPEEAARRSMFVLTRFGIDPGAHVGDGVHLVTSPLYHAAPITNASCALHLGHTVVVMPRFDAVGSLALIGRHGVTSTHVVPTMMKRWLDLPAATREGADVRTMRWLIHAAAPCPVDVKRRIIEWFGPVVYEYYSSTEAGGTSIDSADWLRHPGSVGRPWPGADVKVLAEDGSEAAAGEVGQIYLRNVRPFVYHHDPGKTADNRRGEYVTVGDLGSLDEDGYLHLADRRTDLILSGGVNVYPAEIEAVLLTHPGVADAAVIGVPDPDLGEVVHAVVEPRGDDRDGLAAALLAHCAAHLADFKRPRHIEVRDTLPRSEAGKLLRRVLRDEARQVAAGDP